jgi:hypothetical protein
MIAARIYPFSSNRQGRAFLNALPISPAENANISHLNAEQLLRLGESPATLARAS